MKPKKLPLRRSRGLGLLDCGEEGKGFLCTFPKNHSGRHSWNTTQPDMITQMQRNPNIGSSEAPPPKRLVRFIYLMMRDHVLEPDMNKAIEEIKAADPESFRYSNVEWAQMADVIAKILMDK